MYSLPTATLIPDTSHPATLCQIVGPPSPRNSKREESSSYTLTSVGSEIKEFEKSFLSKVAVDRSVSTIRTGSGPHPGACLCEEDDKRVADFTMRRSGRRARTPVYLNLYTAQFLAKD